MEYVLNEDGSIKVTDGKPTVKDKDDKEFGIDAIGAQEKITSITAESNDRRKKLGEANTKLETFSGIDDPIAAIDALQKVSSMDDDKKVEMENLKDTINKAWEAKATAWDNEKEELNNKLFDATVGVNFATSKVIAGTVLPPDIAKATFGKHFNPDGTANDAAGNLIYSKAKPGESASFDEAMQVIIDNYPAKDAIMKGSGANGSGGHTGGAGDAGGAQEKSSHEKIAGGLKSVGVV